MAAVAELRTDMCPSSDDNRSSAEGQRRASHSLCELGTTQGVGHSTRPWRCNAGGPT